MIKLDQNRYQDGIEIYLPESWHEQLESLGKSSYPYNYTIALDGRKEIICKGVKNKKTYTLRLSDTTLKYLTGDEVPDSNIGFSFKEYLPVDDTALIITGGKNEERVSAKKLKSLCKINEDGVPEFNFYKVSLIDGTEELFDGNTKDRWKFMYNTDISYMNELEKMFQDTFIHKGYVTKSCKKLANYLMSKDIENHAMALMERAKVHDNSKITCEDELRALSGIIEDKSCLRDASSRLSQLKLDAIKLHHKHNAHHPEHFKNCEDMTKLDIMEMCCDWHARSTQYGTDLIEFVKIRQEDRFHFPQRMYEEILYYCNILIRE